MFLWCGYLNAHSQVSDNIWQLKDFKNDEKCFLFHIKALFVVKICKFLSWLFDHVEKRLDSKNKINFKIYDVTAWLTNNCNTHIYQYLKSKSNQATKFGQLIECYTRNIFLGKSYTKYDRKTFPRPFSKKSKLSIFLDQYLAYSDFIVCQVENYRDILNLSCRPLSFTSNKTFKKNKKRSGTVSLPHFLHGFWRKIICYYLTKFHCVVVFTSWDIGQYAYCNCLLTSFWRHKFWN